MRSGRPGKSTLATLVAMPPWHGHFDRAHLLRQPACLYCGIHDRRQKMGPPGLAETALVELAPKRVEFKPVWPWLGRCLYSVCIEKECQSCNLTLERFDSQAENGRYHRARLEQAAPPLAIQSRREAAKLCSKPGFNAAPGSAWPSAAVTGIHTCALWSKLPPLPAASCQLPAASCTQAAPSCRREGLTHACLRAASNLRPPRKCKLVCAPHTSQK